MKRLVGVLAVVAALAVGPPPSGWAEESTDEARIRAVIHSYEQALGRADVDAVVGLFAQDGVAMIQRSPTRVGAPAVREFYEALFKTLAFAIRFEIVEVVRASSEWAFVRCTSQGTVTVLPNGAASQSAGQELFVLQKQAKGSWKIARYAGSSTK